MFSLMYLRKATLEGYRKTEYLIDVGENCGKGVEGQPPCICFYSLSFEPHQHLPFPFFLPTCQQGLTLLGSEDSELHRTQMCVFPVKEAGI